MLRLLLMLCLTTWGTGTAMAQCSRTITADVVAFDQAFFWNRLGAVQPQGMMYALRRDVVPIDSARGLAPGNVQLRAGKRPRPLVLRMNVGDCLAIQFQNLLASAPVDNQQPATRTASIRALGLQLVNSIASDGSNVGANASSLVSPGGTATYTYYAEREASHLLYSAAAQTGGEGDGGSMNAGLFGAITVQPAGAEWYRSQITNADLMLATTGTTPGGQPIVNYNATRADGTPILKMLKGTEIVHSDVTALITGPNAGRFPAGTYRPNPATPDRNQPFREFTIIYHDEIGAIQAFAEFEDPVLSHTLHSARDAFAINYGTAGAGAEVLANRFGVGPMHDCTECKYEEFFLSSWTVGDPAMVVDVPANAPCKKEDIREGRPCTPTPGPKATKVFYPDDPSNVYHSYLGDHVKFRILHAGSKEHHVHHQHAHQWLLTPDSDNSNYLDSQAIGPGAAYTLEMTYNGSGNRNQTPGDSIFHCHFYPHFAQGMWALWRVHDVFEAGTQLDANGRPQTGSRALPDGEIAAGTPIPATVPVPTLGMAPMPGATVSIANGDVQISGTGNPGFPFFVPAKAGHRPPKPPLDTVDDGGLPRHIIVDGTFHEKHTRLDFSKDLLTADARAIPETGTATEVAAMNFHAQRTHSTYKPDGTAGTFITNGRPAVAGAPFADPCVTDTGAAVGNPRTYKAAVIQLDLKLNKAGWHYPQQRIEALWDDVAATKNGTRAPEPFFFRANTNDCISFFHTVLTPHYYEMDDFQVRTPTDVMGQHIHLVKFDVLASDGAGNGFNYEDGTFAPDEVLERIHAINQLGGLQGASGTRTVLTARAHPFFTSVLGAQTTVQRWYADNLLNNAGKDRTLRTVFSHDHFGPSTHQQAGLYAGLVVEPQGSTWRNPDNGQTMGSRFDGGPTSWRADILTPNSAESFREFLLQIADFQLAYKPNSTFPDPANVINPPAKKEVGLPKLLAKAPDCPGGVPLPCPEAFSADDPGTMAVNYRNEPLALRVRDPNTNGQAASTAGDLAHAFRSNVTRADSAFNSQPSFYPPLTPDVGSGDPFTPLMRAYQGDRIQVRMLVGAHEEGHNFSMNGVRWLAEPSEPNSGFKNSQMMGISEHFEFVLPSSVEYLPNPTDYLYRGASTDDLWNGVWGLMRVFDGRAGMKSNLQPLPNNPTGSAKPVSNPIDFTGLCPNIAPKRYLQVTATTAQQALPNGTLVYNAREGLNDPTAIIYVRTADLDSKTGKLKTGVPIEPLILRANAGECIQLTLTNKLPSTLTDLAGFNTLPMIVENFNNNDLKASTHVGLHPQLLTYWLWMNGDGMNAGNNLISTVAPNGTINYIWYAGAIDVQPNGTRVATPVEFGATNLMPADPIKQGSKGAIGALIIEPKGATWTEDTATRAAATVSTPDGKQFREFVVLMQNDVNLRFADGSAVPNTAEAEDPEDSAQKGLNYRTEPMWARMNFAPQTDLETTRTFDFTNALSNSQVGGDPVTPVFTAKAGTPVRFRVVHPSGKQRNNVFTVHGHGWQRSPYVNNSTAIGSNPLSEWTGAEMGVGPSAHLDAPVAKAGGAFLLPGDYLYRTFQSFQFDGGMWGIFRVTP
ncbi:MAG TPA: copper oxidase [Thermoanaerobaculia bacterium]